MISGVVEPSFKVTSILLKVKNYESSLGSREFLGVETLAVLLVAVAVGLLLLKKLVLQLQISLLSLAVGVAAQRVFTIKTV
jgi:hypothetical protein